MQQKTQECPHPDKRMSQLVQQEPEPAVPLSQLCPSSWTRLGMEHLPSQHCGHGKRKGKQEAQPGIAPLQLEANKLDTGRQAVVKWGECSPSLLVSIQGMVTFRGCINLPNYCT